MDQTTPDGPREFIDPELEPLLPRFYANVRKELDAIDKALGQGDLGEVQRIAHSIKGSGLGYGFEGLGALGGEMETAASNGHEESIIREIMDDVRSYLDTVQVEFFEE
jgi:HPt (histidine-containing phosphotransfer) domain-containing protein